MLLIKLDLSGNLCYGLGQADQCGWVKSVNVTVLRRGIINIPGSITYVNCPCRISSLVWSVTHSPGTFFTALSVTFFDWNPKIKKNKILNILLIIMKRLFFIGGGEGGSCWACHDVTFLL
jgi:hypothetical protein